MKATRDGDIRRLLRRHAHDFCEDDHTDPVRIYHRLLGSVFAATSLEWWRVLTESNTILVVFQWTGNWDAAIATLFKLAQVFVFPRRRFTNHKGQRCLIYEDAPIRVTVVECLSRNATNS